MTNCAIEVRNLCKRYADFELKDVSLRLPSGCVLGLVGENGAGKSTIINLLMNAIARDGGEAKVLGVDPAAPEFTRTKQDIGVVLDEAHFPELLNAMDVGKIMASCYDRWNQAMYRQYIDRFNLPPKKPFKNYSRGMKMKLSIAVALSHGARLLVLDEPTGGLDPMVRDEILDILNDFTRDEDHSILISSHIISDLEKICDHIAFVHRGRLLFCEEKDRLMEEYALLRLTRADFEAVPEEAVVSLRENPYGVEAMVRRELVTPALVAERATLEEIILFFVKGADAR